MINLEKQLRGTGVCVAPRWYQFTDDLGIWVALFSFHFLILIAMFHLLINTITK
ncbi:hypothetical protein VB264_15625 [Arcicella aquatica]|uniref:Uncharacterized protein n=1 Tax=Arcicella aquatica TaxID=217141 RepID=A0ABU5QQ62_9BACT|nr:hypothetical protein [Arcicella aquatica]MEA5259226.1 hypothetical protein [Arcicella aquatica]